MPKSIREKLDELDKSECIVISLEKRASYSTVIQRSFHGVPTNEKIFTIRKDKKTNALAVWRIA